MHLHPKVVKKFFKKKSIEAFIHVIKISRHLLCQTIIKVRCTCKLLMKVNIMKAQNREQYCLVPLSQSVPKTSSILKGFNRMQTTEKAGLMKLFEVAYLIALKGRPFSDYSYLLELEKIHGVKFLEMYEHRNSCREFIDYTSSYLVNKDVKNKLLKTNLIGVLNDGTTNAAIVEQEVIYVTFLNPDNFEPCLTFLTDAELNSIWLGWGRWIIPPLSYKKYHNI